MRNNWLEELIKKTKGHTPGPWGSGLVGDPDMKNNDDAGSVMVGSGKGCVAECRPDENHANTWSTVRSNAHLIAAAPRLLRMVIDLTEQLQLERDSVAFLARANRDIATQMKENTRLWKSKTLRPKNGQEWTNG